MNQQLTSSQIEYAFYREVAEKEQLFTIMDDKGIPTPEGSEGEKVMPFWSSEQKVLDFLANSTGFEAFKPLPISWETFSDKWVDGMAEDDLLVGMNWVQADAENCITEIELALKGIIECFKNKPIKRHLS